MKNLFLAVLLLLPVALDAQTFKPGYVVTNEKDTLYGQLSAELDQELAYGVDFIQRGEDTANSLTPTDLVGFGFESGRTFRKVEPRNHQEVFAKQVETGQINVLIWEKKKERHPDMFLNNKETGETVQLTRPKKRRITTESGKEYSQEDKQYLALLNYIKGGDADDHRPRYNERKIRKDIRTFNEDNREEYPVSSYREKRSREYIIFGGTAVDGIPFSENMRFRAGLIQTRTRDERTRTFSYLSGIFYTYRNRKAEIPDNRNWNGRIENRIQRLSLIPVGARLQTKGERFKPYVYGGLGVGIAKNEEHVIENSEITGNNIQYGFSPILVVGAGVRVKTGKNFIVAEVNPALEGIFMNLGYSF